jgi:DNA end-binding protein Ku
LPDDLGDVPKPRLRDAEVKMATALVENLSDKFEPEKYNDTYRKELLQLIRAKDKGKELPEPEEREAEVIDLMAALRESVEKTKRSGGSKRSGARARKRPRASAAKKSGGKRASAKKSA